MMRDMLALLLVGGLFAQAPDGFEVATIKPTAPDWRGGRYLRMESGNRFVGRNHTVRTLLAFAYNLTPKAVLGGPDWVDSERWDIEARTPGEKRPNPEQQMNMLAKLLEERFAVAMHRETRVMSLYTLSVAKSGTRLKETELALDDDRPLINVVYADRVLLPARNATMAQFASLLQRSVLSRPVVDRTGLMGRFDFELEWTPDESQFGGQGPASWQLEGIKPSLFAALQEQLGLRLEAGRGPVEVLVIDKVERPSAN